jgi:hypothetical protein
MNDDLRQQKHKTCQAGGVFGIIDLSMIMFA